MNYLGLLPRLKSRGYYPPPFRGFQLGLLRKLCQNVMSKSRGHFTIERPSWNRNLTPSYSRELPGRFYVFVPSIYAVVIDNKKPAGNVAGGCKARLGTNKY
jgi:hypothetical protein